MKNDNEERLIEFLVTIGTLIFFGFLSMYVLRGCSDEHSINGNLASPAAMGTVVPTTIAETDAKDVEASKTPEVDRDVNVSSDENVEVAVKAPAVAETGAKDVEASETSELDRDVNVSSDENVEVAVKSTAVEETDAKDVEASETSELDRDVNVSSDENVEVAVKSTTVASVATLSQTDDDTSKKDEVDKLNTKKDDNQSDKTKEVKERTEAEEEAGIIADIESERVSSKPYVLKGIYFRTGSAVLTAKSKRQLDAIGKALKLHKDVIITLRGHTDKMGSSKKNELLSIKRAATVGFALVDRGANIDNIWTVGMGESEPITSNGSAKEMFKNRRVDIAVTK